MRAAAAGLFAAAAVAACAPNGGDGLPDSGPSVIERAPSTAGEERVGLSLKHDGSSVEVSASSRITLVLGGRYRWRDPTSEGADVEIVPFVSDAPEGGQVWELTPRGTGTVMLRSEGSPACRPATPGCPDQVRVFTVTLEVRR